MRISADTYLSQVKNSNFVRHGFRKTVQILSLLVIVAVFWGLKLTGITMAGEAFCGRDEHVHDDICMVRELTCTLEEVEGHTHTDECMVETLHCTLGHTHGEGCFEDVLTCTEEESESHTHADVCYAHTLTCTLPEECVHIHAEECFVPMLTCAEEESDNHTHGAGCYTAAMVCTPPEGCVHSHADACFEAELICTEAELPGHTHGEGCFAEELVCTEEESEEHTHGEGCFAVVQTCTGEETQGHTHTDGCYAQNLICTLPEAAPHIHTRECCTMELGCGLEETEGHTHADECYLILEECPIEEHIHTEDCYSDYNADIEDEDDWEASVSGLIRNPNISDDIVMIARSQLGVAESTRNFRVDANGVRRGITRYGQWYGNPYGDWSAMFACFCLDYTGILDIPMNAGPEALRLEWEAQERYAPAADHWIRPGQLVFLDKNGDGAADAVAVVADLQEGVILAIEGDLDDPVTQLGGITVYTDEELAEMEARFEETGQWEDPDAPTNDRVARTLYAVDDPVIMGYALVPMEPGQMILAPGDRRYIYLDGTNGGIMSLGGTADTRVAVREGDTYTLPTSWQSPDKYSYRLRGWYDVTNSKYYEPGAQITVPNKNLVFYADWAASTYDIGQFNSQVADTVSTNDFVTVRMFDYGVLFNVLSERANVTANNNSHSETWNLITGGNNPYNGQPTLNYILRDWDRGSEDISYPNGTNDRNNPTDAGTVFPGLYTGTIGDLLFNPGTQVIGKQYLGTADHLFQLCLDPAHEHYGYYYYNSERNAASYNQSAGRFYVYEYLECTRTSAGSGDEGKYSDFLPLNSPYANTNGKQVNTYNYSGIEGEYNGTTHYMYDCRYNDSNNSPNYVGTNFWFGMSVDIEFYLPNAPGTTVSGGYGNQDIYGKDMHFKFTGDDDVWAFVDGKMVLDLGGIHGMESGDINFSTGVVTINGVVNQNLSNTLKSLGAGEHTLSLYYLERGSSMSNCAIYFNLAPRFSFSIEKEDVLTRDVLNGAQFSVYMDQACTVPAQLWTSKASHDRKDPATNVFTVTNGAAHMWGMGAGNVYYIKETKAPDNSDYEGIPNGIIRLSFDKLGTANYDVEIIDTGGGVSGGFTVHGFRLDPETQQAYIIATNAPKWAKVMTTIEARKLWKDQKNHNGESVTVYLTVTDPDGTVRRLREDQLSSANGWYHKWENLPKYWEDGTPVQYGVEEAYIPGYYSKVEKVNNYTTTTKTWQNVGSLENGKTYILGTNSGYLSTIENAADTGYKWVSEDVAKTSPLARWKVTQSGSTYRLTNEAGQTITFYYGGGSPTDFYASNQLVADSDNNNKQYLSYSASGNNIRLYYHGYRNNTYTDYYLSSMLSNGKFDRNTSSGNAIVFSPKTEVSTSVNQPITAETAFLVTNTPLAEETSVTVRKNWDYGRLDPSKLHEQFQVTVKLLADGKDTGRTVTLTLKNGWTDTFRGLPYKDANGKVINYTVQEIWKNTDWVPDYGEVVTSGGSPPTYSTTVTNWYRYGIGGPALPSTGTAARLMYILCGGGIMLSSLVYGILSRRKRERRMK